jgi:hypothetical protein
MAASEIGGEDCVISETGDITVRLMMGERAVGCWPVKGVWPRKERSDALADSCLEGGYV